MTKRLVAIYASFAILIMVLPFATFLLFFNQSKSDNILSHIADQKTVFYKNRDNYIKQIESLPISSEPVLIIFPTGGMVGSSSGVVYDETDEISVPKQLQSSKWIVRAGKTELGCGYSTQMIDVHFYIADFAC